MILRGGIKATLVAIASTIAQPASAQDRDHGDSAVRTLPPIVVASAQSPEARANRRTAASEADELPTDRVMRVGDACRIVRRDPANGIASFAITMPWRGAATIVIEGSRDVQLMADAQKPTSDLVWQIINPDERKLVAIGKIWQPSSERGRATALLAPGKAEFESYNAQAATKATLAWITARDRLGKFPARWMETGTEEWQDCRAQLGDHLKSRRDPRPNSPPGPTHFGDAQAWMPPVAYPPASRRAGESGTAVIELSVDEFGYPTGCSVMESSGYERLDSAACDPMMRASVFYPARDANDEAVPGKVRQPIIWQLVD